MASSTKLNIKNPQDFAVALLGELGAPDTKQNVTDVTAWVESEGGNWNNTASFNPLDTTLPEPGSKSFDPNASNPDIQAYTSWAEGLEATVSTLEDSNPAYGYQAIIDAIDGDKGWNALVNALKASSWDGSTHYAGSDFIKDTNTDTPTGKADTPSTGGANPDSGLYATGQAAADSTDSAANDPSKSDTGKSFGGFAGVLQQLNGWYNPKTPGVVSSITSLGLADVEYASIMIFVRATSAILSLGVILIGVRTILGGSQSGGGGGSPSNVLEFVNAQKAQNARIGLGTERIDFAKEKEHNVATRTEQRLANDEANRTSRERVAATPRFSFRKSENLHYKQEHKTNYSESHIHHHTTPKPSAAPKSGKPRKTGKVTLSSEAMEPYTGGK
jgi:hypothetical protein